jgi:hypothetical protein
MLCIIEEGDIFVRFQTLAALLTHIDLDQYYDEYPKQQEQLDCFCNFWTANPIKKCADQNIDSSMKCVG